MKVQTETAEGVLEQLGFHLVYSNYPNHIKKTTEVEELIFFNANDGTLVRMLSVDQCVEEAKLMMEVVLDDHFNPAYFEDGELYLKRGLAHLLFNLLPYLDDFDVSKSNYDELLESLNVNRVWHIMPEGFY